MKVGVLGCNGFLGRYFLEHNKWIPITREEVDLLNPASVEKFFHRYNFSVIIHCAVVGGSRLKEDSNDVLKENILMFENVSRFFNGKLIYFSSGAVFNGNPPTDPYGLSKWIIDKRITQIPNAYKVCNLVYRERLKLSDWAKKFGATYEIINKKELGEPYISDIRNDLSQIEESVRYNSDNWGLFC